MRKLITTQPCLLALVSFLMTIATTTPAQEASKATERENHWEAAIGAFERQDELKPPKKHGVLFVGSSSIRKWDLKKSFPKLEAINRGFGGSEVSDALHFADRIILKYEPRVVVLYAGDNDIARGESPEQVRDDFQALTAKIHEELPKTKIVFVAIKPSLARWKLVGEMRAANRMIRQITNTHEQLEFVDIDKPMLGNDGLPRPELFVADGLHLSDKGYKLWASLVKPHLQP